MEFAATRSPALARPGERFVAIGIVRFNSVGTAKAITRWRACLAFGALQSSDAASTWQTPAFDAHLAAAWDVA
jgi:hypothetical protein